MNTQILWIIMALVTWGFYGFFPKLVVKFMTPQSAIIYEVLGGLVVGLFSLYLIKFQPEANPWGILYAFLTGAAAIIGGFFYLKAATTNSISIVAPLTALYPIVTIMLAFVFLHEQLTWRQLLGIGLSIIAIWLIAGGD